MTRKDGIEADHSRGKSEEEKENAKTRGKVGFAFFDIHDNM